MNDAAVNLATLLSPLYVNIYCLALLSQYTLQEIQKLRADTKALQAALKDKAHVL